MTILSTPFHPNLHIDRGRRWFKRFQRRRKRTQTPTLTPEPIQVQTLAPSPQATTHLPTVHPETPHNSTFEIPCASLGQNATKAPSSTSASRPPSVFPEAPPLPIEGTRTQAPSAVEPNTVRFYLHRLNRENRSKRVADGGNLLIISSLPRGSHRNGPRFRLLIFHPARQSRRLPNNPAARPPILRPTLRAEHPPHNQVVGLPRALLWPLHRVLAKRLRQSQAAYLPRTLRLRPAARPPRLLRRLTQKALARSLR